MKLTAKQVARLVKAKQVKDVVAGFKRGQNAFHMSAQALYGIRWSQEADEIIRAHIRNLERKVRRLEKRK